MGFTIPHNLVALAKDGKRMYPFAVALQESVKTYSQATQRMLTVPGVATLLAAFRRDLHSHVARGMHLRWESLVGSYDFRDKQVPFVREFASSVTLFQEKVDDAIAISQEVYHHVDQLASCAYESPIMLDLMSKIQQAADRLSLENFSNLELWTRDLNEHVEVILAARLQGALKAWIAAFSAQADASDNIQLIGRRSTVVAPGTPPRAKLVGSRQTPVKEDRPVVFEVGISFVLQMIANV